MVKIKLNKQEYTLDYTNKVLFDIERKLDISIIKLFQNKEMLEKIHVIYTIVHCGIVEDISFDDFSDSVNFDELGKVLPKALSEITEGFNSGLKKK